MSKQDIFLRIRRYAQAHFQRLNPDDFVLGESPLNQKCHINAVQKVYEGKAAKVLSCFVVDTTNNSQCVHFINRLEDGKYQDNTWGWLYKYCEYYAVKEISPDEQAEIWDELTNLKEMLLLANTNALERFLFRIKKADM